MLKTDSNKLLITYKLIGSKLKLISKLTLSETADGNPTHSETADGNVAVAMETAVEEAWSLQSPFERCMQAPAVFSPEASRGPVVPKVLGLEGLATDPQFLDGDRGAVL